MTNHTYYMSFADQHYIQRQPLYVCRANWSDEVETHAILQQARPSEYIWHFDPLFPGQFCLVADSVDWAAHVGVD